MDLSKWLALALSLCATCFVSVGHAAPHRHDGFYLQLTTGAGGQLVWASYMHPNANGMNARDSATSGGPGLSSSLFLGGAVAPGVILGGGALLSAGFQSAWKRTAASGESYQWESSNQAFVGALALLGPLLDYYPNPSSGVHLQALVGYAALGHSASEDPNVPQGLGLMAGLGQDFWTGDEWSIGVLARVVYAHTIAKASPEPERDNTFEPSLNATFTYN
jgi:hypothetical protein